MLYVLVVLIAFGLWLYSLFEVLTTDEADARGLSKFSWLLVVLLTFWVGAILWWVFGRPRRSETGTARRPNPPAPGFPNQPAPTDLPAKPPRGPDDDADFLRNLDRRLRGEE